MEFWEALKPYKPYWRGALLLVMLATVSFGVYHLFFACPRVQASAPPDHLEVRRTVTTPGAVLPQAPAEWNFGASQAQQVLSAIDALPAATRDTRFCPLSDGTTFTYTFFRGHTIVLQGSALEGGCDVLNLSGCDIRQEEGSFLLLMEGLLNVSTL